MNILVTGATGFIGRECCRQVSERGGRLHATSRSGGDWGPGQGSMALDLDGPLPPGLMQGIDAVIHCAGIAHQRAPEDAYDRINRRATVALAQAAAAAGVSRFVFVSSVRAMGPAVDGARRTESDMAPPADAYGRSKREAETALQDMFRDSDLDLVIVRPALVYGAGVQGNLALLARAVRHGLPRPPALGARSMIACRDLAALLVALAIDAPRGTSTFIAADGEDYSSRRICDALRAAAGRDPGLDWLPAAGWRLGCALLDTVSSGAGSFEKLFGCERYSSDALRARGWSPDLCFEDEAAGILSGVQG